MTQRMISFAIAVFLTAGAALAVGNLARADGSDPVRDFYEATRGVALSITKDDQSAKLFSDGLFTDAEKQTILKGMLGRDYDKYYGPKVGDDRPKSLPPGLARKLARGGKLPTGWEKKFTRGEVIDTALWKHRNRLPYSIRRKLRAIKGTEVIRIDDKIARIAISNKLIIDVVDILGAEQT